MDIFLRAPSEASLLEALTQAGLMGEEGPIQASHTHALDVIGIIPGKAGYHANLRVSGEPHPALASVTIAAPVQAMRVWA